MGNVMNGSRKLSIIGAASRTGRLLTRLASADGHLVTGLARDRRALDALPELHRGVVGDATDRATVDDAVQGQDAVITVVATADRRPSTAVTDIMRTVVTAMHSNGVARLIITSSRNLTATEPRIMVAPTKWIFRHVYADLARAEELVRSSGLDWTIVRATMLTDDPSRGGVHIDTEPDATGGDWKLPRADYARTLLDTALDTATVQQAIGVNGMLK